MSFNLSGSIDSTSVLQGRGGATAAFGVAWNTSSITQPFGGISLPGSYSYTFAITPAMLTAPIFFSIALQTQASMGNPIGGPIEGSYDVDYSNTVTLTQVRFFEEDAQGNPVDVTGRVVLTSASGADYLSTVPEPGTIVLLGTGLTVLAAATKRRVRNVG